MKAHPALANNRGGGALAKEERMKSEFEFARCFATSSLPGFGEGGRSGGDSRARPGGGCADRNVHPHPRASRGPSPCGGGMPAAWSGFIRGRQHVLHLNDREKLK